MGNVDSETKGRRNGKREANDPYSSPRHSGTNEPKARRNWRISGESRMVEANLSLVDQYQ
jgi:hypothetical protein